MSCLIHFLLTCDDTNLSKNTFSLNKTNNQIVFLFTSSEYQNVALNATSAELAANLISM